MIATKKKIRCSGFASNAAILARVQKRLTNAGMSPQSRLFLFAR
jgi:hypothetical protein